MKKKELKRLAEEIAKCELLIHDKTASQIDVYVAKEKIMNLSGKVSSLEDIMILDELIQQNMKKLKEKSS